MSTTVYEKRGYAVSSVDQARSIADRFLNNSPPGPLPIVTGLPEVDDRYHVWRVPLTTTSQQRLGELVIDARTREVQSDRSTSRKMLRDRCQQVATAVRKPAPSRRSTIARVELSNTIMLGDSEETLKDLPAASVDLVFTSPPYFNARPGYAEYRAYEDYLAKICRVICECHRLLAEGRFLVVNTSPVLLRRQNRNRSSRRLAVPFDLHGRITESGFEFIDDIVWMKPSGAGWATGRGRRFAADRHPLQYKAVPVTEYVMVYRKQTKRLIDWNIRSHADQQAVRDSRIGDGYERTNVWRLSPRSTKKHPAVFPQELVERVVSYYSFVNDVVLDPFAGIGTVGEVAAKLRRRFVLSELSPDYVDIIKEEATAWLGNEAMDIRCINTAPIVSTGRLF